MVAVLKTAAHQLLLPENKANDDDLIIGLTYFLA